MFSGGTMPIEWWAFGAERRAGLQRQARLSTPTGLPDACRAFLELAARGRGPRRYSITHVTAKLTGRAADRSVTRRGKYSLSGLERRPWHHARRNRLRRVGIRPRKSCAASLICSRPASRLGRESGGVHQGGGPRTWGRRAPGFFRRRQPRLVDERFADFFFSFFAGPPRRFDSLRE